MGKLIAFSGSHGTGKTTSVFNEANKLKISTNGNVGVLTNTSRSCPFTIFTKNSKATEEAQMYIFTKMVSSELEYKNSYDIVVTDRTIIDVIAYTYASGHSEIADAMKRFAKSYIKQYDKIYLKLIVRFDYLVDDNLRSMDRDFRACIENKIIDLYQQLNYENVELV